MLNDKLYVLWWRMCNPYDIANYGVSRQPPDHTAQTRSHGTNQVTRDKSGTKRDLQEPNGDPGYGVTVHMSILWGWINLIRGVDVINTHKTNKIVGFYAVKYSTKISNGPPFGSFPREKMKIAHLLPERSAHRDDHFLQTWPLLSGALD